ncbi:Dynein assembly factor 1, axonemal [Boothiomyces sp. JEL0838]|nr:Dynein assembly factor 1, axonemal [Boothiomyces sp. JEL0838]
MLSDINLDAKSWLARRRNAKEVDEKGNTLMTLAYLKQLCKEQKVYQTPELNDILYLHFKGFSKIENLDLYTGLKSLWLEGNGISKIENIETIENLDKLEKLDTLNVGNNLIKKIKGLGNLKQLKTLQIQNNFLVNYDDISGLLDCPSITVLDLSNNKIEDPEIVSILEKMPNLAVLNLMGNPVIRKIVNYRRVLVSKIKTLTYLDDRPIFEKERLTTDAWAVGGMEGERLERERIYEEEKKKQEANFEAMRILQETGRKKRLEKYGEEQEPVLSEKMQEFKDEMLARIEPKNESIIEEIDAESSATEQDEETENETDVHDDLLEEVYEESQATAKIEEHHVPPRKMEIVEEPSSLNNSPFESNVKSESKKVLIEEITPESNDHKNEYQSIITDEDIKEANALQYQLDIEQSIPTILINDLPLEEDVRYTAPMEQSQAEKEILREMARFEGEVEQESLLNEEEKAEIVEMLHERDEEYAGVKIEQVDDEIEVITTDGYSKQSTLVELDERKKAW